MWGKRSNGGRGGSSRYLPGRRGARIPSRPGRARGPSRRRPCAPCHSACRQSRTAAPSCRRMATAFHRQGWSFPRRPRHRGGRRPAGAGPAAGRRPRGRPGRSDPHAARPCRRPRPRRARRTQRRRPLHPGSRRSSFRRWRCRHRGRNTSWRAGRTNPRARAPPGPPVRLRTGARPGSGVRCRLHDQPLPPGPTHSPPAVVRKATRQADAFVEALGQAGRSALTGSGDGVAGRPPRRRIRRRRAAGQGPGLGFGTPLERLGQEPLEGPQRGQEPKALKRVRQPSGRRQKTAGATCAVLPVLVSGAV